MVGCDPNAEEPDLEPGGRAVHQMRPRGRQAIREGLCAVTVCGELSRWSRRMTSGQRTKSLRDSPLRSSPASWSLHLQTMSFGIRPHLQSFNILPEDIRSTCTPCACAFRTIVLQ